MQPSKRVVIVEDDPGLQAKFKSKVQEVGFEVDTASTKAEALEKVRCRTYHVAMVDIMLTKDTSDRGGIEVIKYINSLKEGTEIVVWSMSDDVRVPVEAFGGQKVSAYLVKKDIRSARDYLVKIEEAYKKCQMKPYGRFNSLTAYLASPELTPYYEDQLVAMLGASIDLVYHFLSTVFEPLQPLLRRKDAKFSLVLDASRGMIHGLLWSKGIGKPVYVSLGRNGCEHIRPEECTQNELVFEIKKANLKAAVWKHRARRDEFEETLYTV